MSKLLTIKERAIKDRAGFLIAALSDFRSSVRLEERLHTAEGAIRMAEYLDIIDVEEKIIFLARARENFVAAVKDVK